MKTKIYALLFLLMAFCIVPAFSQGNRSYIKQSINEWGSCRNVAITQYGGSVALNWNNAYASYGIPSLLASALKELNNKKEFIDDVQLTEGGRWLVLYGDNGFRWSGIPADLESTLRQYNNDREVVTSVTFNDNGGWIVISNDHVTASTSEVNGWIREGMESFGQLWAAHMTNDGLVLCYERGYKFMGNVPDNLLSMLKSKCFDHYFHFKLRFYIQG